LFIVVWGEENPWKRGYAGNLPSGVPLGFDVQAIRADIELNAGLRPFVTTRDQGGDPPITSVQYGCEMGASGYSGGSSAFGWKALKVGEEIRAVVPLTDTSTNRSR
jgi:hypothetical protein